MPKLLQIFDLYKTKGYFIFSALAQDTEFFPFRLVMQHRKDKKINLSTEKVCILE